MRKILVLAGIVVMSLGLAACSGKSGEETTSEIVKETAVLESSEDTEKESVVQESQAEDGNEQAEPSEESAGDAVQESEDDSEAAEDEDLEMALFRSSAYSVQNEITTGLTTEYLDGLLSYPVQVNFAEPTVLNSLEDLEKLGLEKLYTDELLKAVGDCDIDSLELKDGKMVIGDPEGANVVISEDENGYIGIVEFNY